MPGEVVRHNLICHGGRGRCGAAAATRGDSDSEFHQGGHGPCGPSSWPRAGAAGRRGITSESIRVYPSLSESIRVYPSLSVSIRVPGPFRLPAQASRVSRSGGSSPAFGPARLRPGFTIDSVPRRLGPLLAAGLSGRRVGPTPTWWPSTHTCWPAIQPARQWARSRTQVRAGGARSAGLSQARRSMSEISGRTWPGGLPYRNVTWSGPRGPSVT